MIRPLLHRLVRHLPEPRVIYDRAGLSPYLSRWYLRRHPREDGVAVFLHCFHRGDDDAELHDHPWRWSFALILSGGYREERRIGTSEHVRVRLVRPGTINVIRGDDYHRVDLLSDEAWSLFVAGPQTGKTWSFWDRVTGAVTPWREFITRKRGPGWKES